MVSGIVASILFGGAGGFIGSKLGPSSKIGDTRDYVKLLRFYQSSLADDVEMKAVVDDLIGIISGQSVFANALAGGVTNILQSIPGLDDLNTKLLAFMSELDSGQLQAFLDTLVNDPSVINASSP